MPWKKTKGGYTTKDGGHVKRPKMYEGMRRRGLSKTTAAKIANSTPRRKKS